MKLHPLIRSVVLSALIALPCLVGGQTSPAQTPPSAMPADKDVPAGARYQVQPDDVLVINFSLSPELDQTVSVHPDGYISLITVGSVYVSGMTVPQVTDAVRKAYAGTLHDAIIDVDLKDFQRPVFYVMGQVTKPGQYDLRYSLTVMQAIAIGGGFALTARTHVILLHRVSAEWAEAKVIDLRKVSDGKSLEADLLVRNGDMVFVPEKAITKFRKYVPYGFGLNYSPGGNYIY